MERKVLSRRAFLALTISGLTACSRLPIRDPLNDPFVAFDKFEHCSLATEQSSNAAQLIQGMVDKSVPPTIVIRDRTGVNVPTLRSEAFSLATTNLKDTTAQALLIPVGYKEEQVYEKFGKVRRYLDRVFENIDVEFPYLKTPQDIEITRVDYLALFADRDKAEDLLIAAQKVHPVDIAVFIVNTKGHIGAYHGDRLGRGRLAIASGESTYSLYTIAHEVGHALGLEDGNRNEHLGHVIPSEALFFDKESLPSKARASYERINPRIVRAGGVCTKDGITRPLYTFYDPRVMKYNIMKSGPLKDAEIEQKLLNREKLFDPIQEEMMLMEARELVFMRDQSGL